MILDSKKFENYHCDQWRADDEPEGIRTLSLEEAIKALMDIKRNAEANNINPSKVPMFISVDSKRYCISGTGFSFGTLGMIGSLFTDIEGSHSERLYYVAPDKRPEEGEYWVSRGVSTSDVSGFVASKPAGERLLRMVKMVLETDEPKSWLDYRETEPNWIQFKFRDEEFDIKKLDEMSLEKGGIITLDILKKCKK